MARVFSFGEVLWDIFPDGKRPGGSPANVAYHLHALGHESDLISRVGDDPNGDELLAFLRERGLSLKHIQRDRKEPTGTVTVEFTDNEPSYTIHKPAAWDFIEPAPDLLPLIREADAFCFASLSQREPVSASTLETILNELPKSCLVLFDLNLRPPFINRDAIEMSIQRANVIKFNEHELETVSDWFDVDNLPARLLKENSDKLILLTMGSRGSALFTADWYIEEKASPISGQGDFVGVGDAFLASVTHQLLQGKSRSEILKNANSYAASVASKKGGMPEIGKE